MLPTCEHISVLGDWNAWRDGHGNSASSLFYICPLNLLHLAFLSYSFYNKTVIIVIALFWVLGVILANYQTWRSGCKVTPHCVVSWAEAQVTWEPPGLEVEIRIRSDLVRLPCDMLGLCYSRQGQHWIELQNPCNVRELLWKDTKMSYFGFEPSFIGWKWPDRIVVLYLVLFRDP